MERPGRRVATRRAACPSMLSGCLLALAYGSACFQDHGPGDDSDAASSSLSGVGSSSATPGSTSEVDGPTHASTSGEASTSSGTSTTVEPSTTTTSTPDLGSVDCEAPMADCVPDPDGVCETDLSSDVDHCGQCDAPCGGQCDDGECFLFKYVFVSGVRYGAILSGAAGADSAGCDAYAELAGLPGTYRAWISDQASSPATRFNRSSVPYVRVDDVVVADDWDDLVDGTLQAPISIDENGDSVDGACDKIAVWTATAPDGGPLGGANCYDWTSNADEDVAEGVGSALVQGEGWSQGGCPTRSCGDSAHLFCFQQ